MKELIIKKGESRIVEVTDALPKRSQPEPPEEWDSIEALEKRVEALERALNGGGTK